MAYTITEAVHVDIRIDGETISADYAPGDVDLPQPIADLLVAQGLATPTAVSSGKKKADPAPADSTPTPSEAK